MRSRIFMAIVRMSDDSRVPRVRPRTRAGPAPLARVRGLCGAGTWVAPGAPRHLEHRIAPHLGRRQAADPVVAVVDLDRPGPLLDPHRLAGQAPAHQDPRPPVADLPDLT